MQPSAPQDLDALLELSGLPVFAVDADRRITRWSPGIAALTGFSEEEVAGLPCLVGIRCNNCLSSCGVYELGEVRGAPLLIYRKDGRGVRVRKYARVLHDAEGRARGAVEILVSQEEPLAGLDLAPRLEAAPPSPLAADAPDPAEARRIRQALDATRHRRVEAAKLLGLSRTTLWRKMKEHGIE